MFHSFICSVIAFHCPHQALELADSNGMMLPMAFHPGYTVLSLFAVVVILMVGFVLAGTDPQAVRWWKTVVVGMIGAGGVSAMHYVGMHAMLCQAVIVWDIGIIAASVVVGVVACTAALAIFFHFTHLWKDSLIWQMATATILALAVCGVHYTGMQAAKWRNSFSPPDLTNETTPHTLFIVVLTLSMVTCAVMLSYLLYRFREFARSESEKACCVLLNCVIRDHKGRVLTTQAGTLPSTVIEKRYLGRGAFDEENGDFLRMLKSSFRLNHSRTYMAKLRDLQQAGSVSTYSLQLFQQFVAAAEDLSRTLGISVEELGYAYCTPTNLMVTLVFPEQTPNSPNIRLFESRGLRFEQPQQVCVTLSMIHNMTLMHMNGGLASPLATPKNNNSSTSSSSSAVSASKQGGVGLFSNGSRPLTDAFAWRDWLDHLSLYRVQVDMPLTPDTRDASLMELLRTVGEELQLDKNSLSKEVLSWRTLLGRYCTTGQHLRLLSGSRDQWKKVELEPMVKAMIEHVIHVDEIEETKKRLEADRTHSYMRQQQQSRLDIAAENSVVRQQQQQQQLVPMNGEMISRPISLNNHTNIINNNNNNTTDNPLDNRPASTLVTTAAPLAMVSKSVHNGAHLYVAYFFIAASGARTKVLMPIKGSWNMLPMVKIAPEPTPATNGTLAPTYSHIHTGQLLKLKQWAQTGTATQPANLDNLPVELHSFQADLTYSLEVLGKQVGSSVNLNLLNVWTEGILNLSPQVRVMLIVTCEMTNRLPSYLMHREHHLQLMPLAVFEILHYGQHENKQIAGWTRKALKAQLGRGKNHVVAMDGGGKSVNMPETSMGSQQEYMGAFGAEGADESEMEQTILVANTPIQPVINATTAAAATTTGLKGHKRIVSSSSNAAATNSTAAANNHAKRYASSSLSTIHLPGSSMLNDDDATGASSMASSPLLTSAGNPSNSTMTNLSAQVAPRHPRVNRIMSQTQMAQLQSSNPTANPSPTDGILTIPSIGSLGLFPTYPPTVASPSLNANSATTVTANTTTAASSSTAVPAAASANASAFKYAVSATVTPGDSAAANISSSETSPSNAEYSR